MAWKYLICLRIKKKNLRNNKKSHYFDVNNNYSFAFFSIHSHFQSRVSWFRKKKRQVMKRIVCNCLFLPPIQNFIFKGQVTTVLFNKLVISNNNCKFCNSQAICFSQEACHNKITFQIAYSYYSIVLKHSSCER